MSVDELNARFSAIQSSIRAEGLLTRRHIDMVVEGLRADIRLIAQQLEAGQERIEGARIPASSTSNEREQRR